MTERLVLASGAVDLVRREVVRGDVRVELRPKEAELLGYLAARPGRTVPREELFEQVWGYHPGSRSRTLDTTVRRLRAAIEDDPSRPRHLLTEVGVGYRFVGADGPGACDRVLRAGADRVRALLARRVPGRVVLFGPHGIGKRTWAIEAASSFPGRVVQAAGPDALVTAALALGVDPSGDPHRLRQRVELVRARTPALVLLEDVPLDEVLRWGPPVVARTVAAPPEDPRYDALPVDPLPRDAARELLGAPADDPDVDRLLDLLGGIPLAIRLAAARLPLTGAAALADELAVHPERVYDGRGAASARSQLEEADRDALDAASSLAGPAPTRIVAAVVGGIARLARLRDQGWLHERDGGWTVPVSLRVAAGPAGRARAARAVAEQGWARCDPLCGPVSWEARAELVALLPTLRALGDEAPVRPLLAWALAGTGAPPSRLDPADGLVYGALSADPAARRLEAVEALPASTARDALRSRLLRQLGRLTEAAALPEPDEAEGPAVGEWWYQRHQLAHTTSDPALANAAAQRAARAWRAYPPLLERARGATAYLALFGGHVAQAERDYRRLAASPDPRHAVEGVLGLGFVALVRGDPDAARVAATRASAAIPTLPDAVAVTSWNQVAMLWREVGAIDGVVEAVAAGLELLALAGGPAVTEGALHGTLGAALVDVGRHDEALVELRVAAEVLRRLGAEERARYAELVAVAARALRGERVEWPVESGEGRFRHLVDALAGRPSRDALRFAEGSADPALRGAALASLGEPVPAGLLACSYEARVAERLRRIRTDVTPVHIGPTAPGSM